MPIGQQLQTLPADLAHIDDLTHESWVHTATDIDQEHAEYMNYLNTMMCDLQEQLLKTPKMFAIKRKELKEEIAKLDEDIKQERDEHARRTARAAEESEESEEEEDLPMFTEEGNSELYAAQVELLQKKKLDKQQRKELQSLQGYDNDIAQLQSQLAAISAEYDAAQDNIEQMQQYEKESKETISSLREQLQETEQVLDVIDDESVVANLYGRVSEHRKHFKALALGTLSCYVQNKQEFTVSPRPGEDAPWAELTAQIEQKIETNTRELEDLQSMWLPGGSSGESKLEQEAYDAALTEANKLDFSFFAKIAFLRNGGTDNKGRKIYMLLGALMPIHLIDTSKEVYKSQVALYLMSMLDSLVVEPYVFVM